MCISGHIQALPSPGDMQSPLPTEASQLETQMNEHSQPLDDLPRMAPPRVRRGASTMSAREVVLGSLGSDEPFDLLPPVSQTTSLRTQSLNEMQLKSEEQAPSLATAAICETTRSEQDSPTVSGIMSPQAKVTLAEPNKTSAVEWRLDDAIREGYQGDMRKRPGRPIFVRERI